MMLSFAGCDKLTGALGTTGRESESVAGEEDGIEKGKISDRDEDVVADPSDKVPVVDFHKFERKPEPVNSQVPVYPAEARQEGHEGVTYVDVLVGPEGNALEVRLSASSGHEELDKAAMDAAKRWTFTPAKQRGRSVKVWVSLPFHFDL